MDLSVLLLGIGLGLRHASDADHVVVVSALVQREPGLREAARVAALWGAGHTAAFLAVGLAIVLGEVRFPPAYEPLAELLVAVMLIAFGLWHLAASRSRESLLMPSSGAGAHARPILIGLVHGVAGSAGVALLAATTIPSRAVAAAYLALFGLGTVLGMVLLTLAMARPMNWAMRREGVFRDAVAFVAALLSILLGVTVLLRVSEVLQ